MDLKGRPGSSAHLKEPSQRLGLRAVLCVESENTPPQKEEKTHTHTHKGKMCRAALVLNISLTFQISA